ncbi:hypothetical protein R4172_04795 [Rhodococcus kroppenstedtii]|uniref:hypothetical protein n=1 Tax=Rhodococcoides kroppenstedtii TaxID=293050 RepID=UPI0029534BD1|nr:hypothetical protein [Rhodococcus kroppenstedtii]MDV7196878.1 hypothetical protein [Rhodococcus kroppenstedtii]
MRLSIVSVIALLIGTIVAAPAGAEPPIAAQDPPSGGAGVGIQLLEAPVSLVDDPRARIYIVDNLPPGTVIDRRVAVTNTSDAPTTVRLYPAAAEIGKDGFVFGNERTQNELSSWMSVTPSEVQLPPGQSAEAIVQVAVPPDATEGERYAVAWAEVDTPTPGGAIAARSRVGIRAYVSVGPGNGPPEEFLVSTITPSRAASGAPEVQIGIDNTGGRALDPSATVTLTGGPGGLSAQPTNGSGDSIAPGASGTLTVALDPALPDGPWTADVSVTSGRVSREGSASVTFPEAGTGTSAELATTRNGGVPFWVWILVAGFVAIAIGVAVTARRRTAGSGHRP